MIIASVSPSVINSKINGQLPSTMDDHYRNLKGISFITMPVWTQLITHLVIFSYLLKLHTNTYLHAGAVDHVGT